MTHALPLRPSAPPPYSLVVAIPDRPGFAAEGYRTPAWKLPVGGTTLLSRVIDGLVGPIPPAALVVSAEETGSPSEEALRGAQGRRVPADRLDVTISPKGRTLLDLAREGTQRLSEEMRAQPLVLHTFQCLLIGRDFAAIVRQLHEGRGDAWADLVLPAVLPANSTLPSLPRGVWSGPDWHYVSTGLFAFSSADAFEAWAEGAAPLTPADAVLPLMRHIRDAGGEVLIGRAMSHVPRRTLLISQPSEYEALAASFASPREN